MTNFKKLTNDLPDVNALKVRSVAESYIEDPSEMDWMDSAKKRRMYADRLFEAWDLATSDRTAREVRTYIQARIGSSKEELIQFHVGDDRPGLGKWLNLFKGDHLDSIAAVVRGKTPKEVRQAKRQVKLLYVAYGWIPGCERYQPLDPGYAKALGVSRWDGMPVKPTNRAKSRRRKGDPKPSKANRKKSSPKEKKSTKSSKPAESQKPAETASPKEEIRKFVQREAEDVTRKYLTEGEGRDLIDERVDERIDDKLSDLSLNLSLA